MQEFINLFQYSFFYHALIAGVLTSILAGIAGTYIVSRKIVFISGGITHASFGGIGIAYFLGLNPFLGAAIFAVLSALGIEWATLKAKIREDSAIAILWSLGMAIGIIFVFLTPGYTPNLMSFLFGNILSVTVSDLVYMAILTIIMVAGSIIFYRLVLHIAFDPDYARAVGVNVNLSKYIISALIALTIVMSIRIAGIILVLSLFTIPQAIAALFTHDFKKIMFLATLWGLAGIITGLIGSYYFNLPSGAIIIFTLILFWVIVKVFKWMLVKYLHLS
jgi:zinc transport system permease protein